MAEVDLVIEICGSAGEGTISAGEILTRCMSDQGYNIMSFDSYPAEIRGFGKCVAHSRISSAEVLSPGKFVHILIALNDAHSISQLPFLKETGIIMYDNKPRGYHEEDQSIAGRIEPGMTSYGIPFLELAQKAAGNARGRNMVALGALAALYDIDLDAFKKTIEKRYAKKKKIVIESNLNSFIEGYNWTTENVTKVDKYTFGRPPAAKKKKLIISGNQAVATAALDSGISLYAGYPITPATKIMEILGKEMPKRDGVMLQVEDEISAIGHVVGAGLAGRRAMTATSGPGFALMSEFLNYAVMTETPAVIVNSQRGGPSTGLPTKTEQSDLNIALYGGSGDSPRVVIAPTSVDECYECTCLAFYLAEKYQTPVVLLIDFFLSNSIKNISKPKPPAKKMLNANVTPSKTALKDYKRFELTKNGISPRALPGTPGGIFVATGLEHDEKGRPVYDADRHTAMTEKRYRKFETMLGEAPKPAWHGDRKDVKVGVLAWGSTAGSAREAVDRARAEGIRSAAMSTHMIYPMPEDQIKKFSDSCEVLLVPELNHTGQYAGVVGSFLARGIERLNQVTALPMPAEDIFQKIKELAD